MSQKSAVRSICWPPVLLLVFVICAAILGLNPADRADWLLENVLVFMALAWLVLSYRRAPLSNSSYGLIFVFCVFHEVGAHFQYADVPYDDWALALSGQSIDVYFDFRRNQYDRLVHFLYGLLLTPVAAEIIDRRVDMRGIWRFLLPMTFMFAQAPIYELLEWAAAEMFGGELGAAYLGTQGDEWDAHKDMAMAGLGSLISLPVWLCRHPRR